MEIEASALSSLCFRTKQKQNKTKKLKQQLSKRKKTLSQISSSRSKQKTNLCKCSILFGIFLCHYRTINVKSNLTKTTLISELSWRLIMYR